MHTREKSPRNSAAHSPLFKKHWRDWRLREKKTTTYEEQDYDKVAEYKYEIADIPPENIAYVDETGIDCYFYREYGYGPKGQLIHGRIKGRKYMRSSIVAAQMEGEIIAPCQYTGTMTHELFEEWFQDHLLPALPKGTVIVMDNASFHRKEQLYCLAQKSECYLIFLPPYSPELNPIEHFWAWLKRTLRKILPKLNSLDEAIFAAFYFRRQLSSVWAFLSYITILHSTPDCTLSPHTMQTSVL